MTIPELLQTAGGTLAALLVVLGVLWRVARPHVVAFIREQRAGVATVEAVKEQLDPAGEDSTRDMLCQLQGQVGDLATEMTLIRAEQTGIKDGVFWSGRVLDRLVDDVADLRRNNGHHPPER